ncbi:MAG: SGNH/GDSL hydrolase family protein [Geodermatophilaceae bacterium]|nr:SGNH/GDSL hydrolase family protein [Geodermatophilaceae bacterium]
MTGSLVRRAGRAFTAGTVASAVAAIAVVSAEAVLAARREYVDPDSAPALEGEFGDTAGREVRLVLLGDSTGAGLGVGAVGETVGGQLAQRLARRGYRVRLAGVAVSGSRCRDLGLQVSRALLGRPDIAVICIGANDALRGVRLPSIRRDLAEAVGRLQRAGVHTFVGTCPDLGASRALAQPLRAIAGRRGRQVAAAEAAATRAANGEPIDIGLITGPVFRADPGTLSEDCFHPSADGYRLWAEALHPAVEAAARDRAAAKPRRRA